MQQFTTPTPVTALLTIPVGRVRLVAGDRSDTTVEVRPANGAKRRDVQAAEQIEISYLDGVLRIAAPPAEHPLLGDSGSVEVTVQLPAGSRVEAALADGEFRSTGRLGEVVLDGSRATVQLDETAGARIAVQAGSLTVGRLGGPAELSTRQGDILVTEAVTGTVVLRTDAGAITVGATAGAEASLDAATSYGRIENALRTSTSGTPDLRIQATTAYGDITARSL
ncbi:hypothetical protein CFP65_3743 [Kitasatospora sp. MMS16-BH015]|uniref:DUF4097 family beta strand repeat-containing protein n=1 Tax=Kitasatospora sp. MMS16-BH015 TaxID=2018025 RepID=UPI000CA2DA4F|nr:DUF4097 family beta strand repeat-containing protein [Kitasatospora sp. MMS16-BH015]AUG78528.1 hypothetical protein CFP65_3743 [Kitasatospora sp. MMS16-BH015]